MSRRWKQFAAFGVVMGAVGALAMFGGVSDLTGSDDASTASCETAQQPQSAEFATVRAAMDEAVAQAERRRAAFKPKPPKETLLPNGTLNVEMVGEPIVPTFVEAVVTESTSDAVALEVCGTVAGPSAATAKKQSTADASGALEIAVDAIEEDTGSVLSETGGLVLVQIDADGQPMVVHDGEHFASIDPLAAEA